MARYVPQDELVRAIHDEELAQIANQIVPKGRVNAIIREDLLKILAEEHNLYYSPAKLTRRMNALGFSITRSFFKRARGLEGAHVAFYKDD